MSSRNTLANIRIILIETSHPGNIGSAARAMKTMGLSQLYLVKPKSFPDEQAIAMSANATDILDNAIVVETLADALTGCQLVVGSSARHARTLSWEVVNPRECAQKTIQLASKNNVALVFGRESSGLTNKELALCHYLVHIPTNPDYSSLNVASAVQILSYECRMASFDDTDKAIDSNLISPPNNNQELVTADDMESYYQQLEATLIAVNFLDPSNPRYLMIRLRRLYNRIRLTRSELNILRGVLSAFQKKQRMNKNP